MRGANGTEQAGKVQEEPTAYGTQSTLGLSLSEGCNSNQKSNTETDRVRRNGQAIQKADPLQTGHRPHIWRQDRPLSSIHPIAGLEGSDLGTATQQYSLTEEFQFFSLSFCVCCLCISFSFSCLPGSFCLFFVSLGGLYIYFCSIYLSFLNCLS